MSACTDLPLLTPPVPEPPRPDLQGFPRVAVDLADEAACAAVMRVVGAWGVRSGLGSVGYLLSQLEAAPPVGVVVLPQGSPGATSPRSTAVIVVVPLSAITVL